MSNLMSNSTVSKSELAAILEVHPTTLYRRMKAKSDIIDAKGRPQSVPLHYKILGMSNEEYRRTKRFTPKHTLILFSHFVITKD